MLILKIFKQTDSILPHFLIFFLSIQNLRKNCIKEQQFNFNKFNKIREKIYFL